MGVIWAGTEIGHFETSGNVGISTVTARRRQDWTRHNVLIPGGDVTSHAAVRLPSARTNFWLSCQLWFRNGPADIQSWLLFLNGSDIGFAFRSSDPNTIAVRKADDSQVFESTSVTLEEILVRLVVHVEDLDSDTDQQHIRIWVNDSLLLDETGDFNAMLGGIDRIQFWSTTPASAIRQTNISEVIIADEPVHGWGVRSVWPTGDGTPFEWSGSYESVNDAVPDEDTLINSDTAGQEAVMGGPDMPTTDLEPKAVFAHAIAQATGSNPSDLELGVKTPNGDRHYGNPQTLTSAFERYTEKFENNPQTSQPWTRAELNDTDMAVRSQD